ncbi:MAG: methyltransferase domain-containing protein [Desulfobulbaceae bacterium]|nr:methyltransferase domain-containing protein [Desulfobulbaceae bacterium]
MSPRKQRWQKYRADLPALSRLILSFTINRVYKIRNDYAARYITGDGYEIGAQNSPVSCDNANKVVYIDYLSRRESSQKYHIPEDKCVDVDIIADAAQLDAIPSNSASFIIANHVLEHCPDPIATLLGWLRILKAKGVLFLTLPNYKSNEFDFEKTPTPVSHLVQDHERAGNKEDITTEHIHEHIRIIDGIDPSDTELFQQRYEAIIGSNLHTHYHVFDRSNVLELLHVIHQQRPITLINSFSFDNSFELLFIIEKGNNQEFQGPMPERQDRLFNFALLLKHMVIFLFSKTAAGRRSR